MACDGKRKGSVEGMSGGLEADIVAAGCFVVGERVFSLRGGGTSNVYIDMRAALGRPAAFGRIARELSLRLVGLGRAATTCVCGVPDGGVAFAAVAGFMAGWPIMGVRRQRKAHGLGGLVYGGLSAGGAECVLIDDVISTGTSLLETVVVLRGEGCKVGRAICIVDRELGGVEKLRGEGVEVECLTTAARIEEGLCRGFFGGGLPGLRGLLELGCRSSAARRLLTCAARKESNIVLSADLGTMAAVATLLELVGDHVCCVKLHADTISGFDEGGGGGWLRDCARRKDFLLMEDRKLADIGSIMVKQVRPLLSWADLVTVHGISGGDSLLHLGELCAVAGTGLVLIGEMSSKNNLIDTRYSREVAAFAEAHPEVVGGIVSQSILTDAPIIHMCPGVKRSAGAGRGDGAGQGYRTPRDALEAGMHMLIVGRDIYESDDPAAVAAEYQKECWMG